MLIRTLFSVALATVQIAAASDIDHQPIDFCLGSSKLYGQPGEGAYGFDSSVDGLNRVAARAIFYTQTKALEVCSDRNYIHGLEAVLSHDLFKDPEGVYVLHIVQQEKFRRVAGEDDTVYTPIEGAEVGSCEIFDIPEGHSITKIDFKYDNAAIRSMEIELSNRKKMSFGYDENGSEFRNFRSSSFEPNGRDVIGFRGSMDSAQHNKSGTPYLKNVEILYNQCTDDELHKMLHSEYPGDKPASRDSVAKKAVKVPVTTEPAMLASSEIHKDYNEQLNDRSTTITALIAVITFMGTILAMGLIYVLLKNRGKCCKGRKAERDGEGTPQKVDAADFSSVDSTSSPVKSVKEMREAYRNRPLPNESVSSLNEMGVTPDSVVMPNNQENRV